MAIDDTLVGSYFLGTESEMKEFLSKDPNKRGKEYDALLVVSGLSLIGFPYTLPIAADLVCRVLHAAIANDIDIISKSGVHQVAKSPGIVGLVRKYLS
ncbi:MAG TPA: hypothetical protein VJA23_06680 [Candidatus Nanoarchaeia archaeon]|nr:hypothetical protein [Candidatus Nanoarchaeia archaeon]